MAIKSGFFDSVDGDRVYNADDFSSIYEGILKNGVIQGLGAELRVTSIYDYKVFVDNGKCVVENRWLKNEGSNCILTVEPAHENLNRIDIVVCGVFESERKADIRIIKGAPAANPEVPEVDFPHVKLARINIGGGATCITNDMIEDIREYAELCMENEAIEWQSDKIYFVSDYHNSREKMQLLPAKKGIIIKDRNSNGVHNLQISISAELKMEDSTYYSRPMIYAEIPEQLQQLDFSSLVYDGSILGSDGILYSWQANKSIGERIIITSDDGKKIIRICPVLDFVSELPVLAPRTISINLSVLAAKQWIKREY